MIKGLYFSRQHLHVPPGLVEHEHFQVALLDDPLTMLGC